MAAKLTECCSRRLLVGEVCDACGKRAGGQAQCPNGFDRAFIAWWVDDYGQQNLGEMTPHDDLASFKAMLAENGWVIAATRQDTP